MSDIATNPEWSLPTEPCWQRSTEAGRAVFVGNGASGNSDRHSPEGGGNAGEAKYEFIWPLGDIVNALVRHDLVVERLNEYPTDADWRFGAAIGEARKLPGQMLLIARQMAQ